MTAVSKLFEKNKFQRLPPPLVKIQPTKGEIPTIAFCQRKTSIKVILKKKENKWPVVDILESCSMSLVVKKMQTKTALRFHVASVIRADIKKVIQQIIQYCIYKIIAILSQLISISAGTGMREKLLFTGENANV